MLLASAVVAAVAAEGTHQYIYAADKPASGRAADIATSDDEPDAEPSMPLVLSEVAASADECQYAVVISAASAAEPKWKSVADALVKKHDGRLVVYRGSVVNCLAFYGDPALRVTVDSQKCPTDVETTFTRKDDLCTFEVRIGKKPSSIAGDQPLAFQFPKRIPGKLTLLSGREYAPVVTNNFLLLAKPKYAPESRYKVEFRVGG